jgi:iron-sulfur cluster repair protein YtfE (RIC family)
MLHQLGQRSSTGDIVALLAECHQRIRKFLSLAQRLAATADAQDDEIRSVAGQVRRYFAEAFPLHLADEDELVPRLARTSPEVDRALAQMGSDHVAHQPSVSSLVQLCGAIEREARHLATTRTELAAVATVLVADLEPHLQLEERVIFPALARLPQAERDALRDDMRARRERVLDRS